MFDTSLKSATSDHVTVLQCQLVSYYGDKICFIIFDFKENRSICLNCLLKCLSTRDILLSLFSRIPN